MSSKPRAVNHVVERYVFELERLDDYFDLPLPIGSATQILDAALCGRDLTVSVVTTGSALTHIFRARVYGVGQPFPLSRALRGVKVRIAGGEGKPEEMGIIVLEPSDSLQSESGEDGENTSSVEALIRLLFGL